MNDTFFKWFYFNSNKRIKVFIGIILGPSGLIALIKAVTPLTQALNNSKLFASEKDLNIFLLNLNFILHLIFLFIVLLITKVYPKLNIKRLSFNLEEIKKHLGFDKEDDLEEPVKSAFEAEKEFLVSWRGFWFDLFFLYIFWTIVQLLDKQIDIPGLYSLIDTFFNNLAAAFLFQCYISLTKITIRTTEEATNVDFKMRIFLLLATLTTLHVVCYLLSLNKNFFYDIKSVNLFFKTISGLLVFLSMATVIGKFDTKFVSSPSIVIMILYCYAAIQPLFVFFDAPIFSNQMVLILYIGLILKVVFFYLFCGYIKHSAYIFISYKLGKHILKCRQTGKKLNPTYSQ